MKPYKSLAIGQVLVAVSVSAGAYESDVHYGLTYWLASKAGYSAQQSHEIARGNELTDTGILDAKHAIVWELCIKRNKQASLNTRDLHFRATREPPAAPADRPVNNTIGDFAQGQTNSVIDQPNHGSSKHQRLFGQALHGWQDSYSHAGISNTFGFCPDNWIWSHPIEKGNVISHVADQTFKDVANCKVAASTTYQYLLRYREPMKLAITSRGWEELKVSVDAFCEAATKEQKADWFNAMGVPQGEAIAKNTSLKNGSRSFFWAPRMDLGINVPKVKVPKVKVPKEAAVQPMIAEYEKQVPGYLPDIVIDDKFKTLITNPPTKAPPEADALARSFLKAWLTSPPDKLPEALAPYFGMSVLKQDNPNITLLRRLRLKDQGSPDTDSFNLSTGAVKVDDYITASPDDWTTYLVPVRGQNVEALVGEDSGVIIVIAILRSAPNEVLMVEARDDDFHIKRLESFISH